jgi:hypothetical protein
MKYRYKNMQEGNLISTKCPLSWIPCFLDSSWIQPMENPRIRKESGRLKQGLGVSPSTL